MFGRGEKSSNITGGVVTPPVVSPSSDTIRWLLGLRLVVISTLFVGILLIQATTLLILPLKYFYGIILSTYGLSIFYIILYLIKLPLGLQAFVQLLGDVGIVTALVHYTGGLYSPFSFLYLAVIVAGAVVIRRGGLIFAGVSAIAYGLLVDLLVFGVLTIPPNITGSRVPPSMPRVLFQLLTHVVGFVMVALLISYLAENLRSTRHRLSREVARSQRFAAVTDHVVRSVAAGIIATDLEGRVLHLNPAGERILGSAAVIDVDPSHIDDIMPLADHSWGLLFTRAHSKSSHRFEDHNARTGIRLGFSVGPLEDETDTVVGYIVNFQDLSELEMAAEHRKVQERMAAVGEMAARMAHEIKNPLASISGSAQMLASKQQLTSTSARLLNILVDESKRLSGILDNFLDYSRPSQGSRRQCDLVTLLKDCVHLIRRSDLFSDAHVIRLETPERLTILGEEPLLRQMFWNLSRNALQALPSGGSLTIGIEESMDTIIISFADTGVGMSDDIRQHAFEPFVTATPGGTGLGLAVVYNAVEQHEGTIQISSIQNEGTTVTIEIPNLGNRPMA